jgi:predicted DNA-binding transcriptional regulator AlpA
MVHDTLDPLLTEKEYRAWLGISAPTAQRQRSSGSGPPFVQISRRRVAYRRSAVEQWLEARTINRVGTLVCIEQAPKPTTSESPKTDAKTPGKSSRLNLRADAACPDVIRGYEDAVERANRGTG